MDFFFYNSIDLGKEFSVFRRINRRKFARFPISTGIIRRRMNWNPHDMHVNLYFSFATLETDFACQSRCVHYSVPVEPIPAIIFPYAHIPRTQQEKSINVFLQLLRGHIECNMFASANTILNLVNCIPTAAIFDRVNGRFTFCGKYSNISI